MAEQKQDEKEEKKEEKKEENFGEAIVDGTGNRISTGVVYAIQGVKSGRYLDGRDGKKDVYMTDGDPKGNAVLNWVVIKTKKGYALKGIKSGRYLDSSGGVIVNKACMTDKDDPTDDDVLSFTFVKTNGGPNNVAIKGVKNGRYLDGRDGQKEAYMTGKDPMDNSVLQFVFIPQNYVLKAKVSNFDYGDKSDVEKILDEAKEIAFTDKKTISCQAKGVTAEGTYGESVEQSFSFGFTKTIGIGIETEFECGIPLIGGSTTKVSAKCELSENQQKTESNTKSFETKYSFTPEDTGIYEVGMTCFQVKDQKLPYTAKVLVTATTDDEEKKPYSGSQIIALLYYGGFNCDVIKVDASSVEAKVSGDLTATFAVSSSVYSKRVKDLDEN